MQTAVTLMVLVTRQKQSWPAFQLINVAISSLVLLAVSRLAFFPSLFLHFHVAVAPRGAVCNATAAMTDRAPLSHATSRRRYDDSQSLLPSLVGSVRFFNLSLKRFFRPRRFAWDLNKKPSFLQPSSYSSLYGPSLSLSWGGFVFPLPTPEMMEYEKYKLSETTEEEGAERGALGGCVCIGCEEGS